MRSPVLLVPLSFASLASLPPPARAGAGAGEGSDVALELKHAAKDCEDYSKWRRCFDRGHFSIAIDGAVLDDRKALDAALRKAAGPRRGSGKEPGRRVLVSPDASAAYEVVWDVLDSCRKAGLRRFEWVAAGARDEKDRGGPVARESPAAPSEVWIRVEDWLDSIKIQIEDGPWITGDREVLAGLAAAGAGAGTAAIIDPGPNIPWSEIGRAIALCRRCGLARVDFLGLPAGPPGYSEEIDEKEVSDLALSLDRAPAKDQPALLDRLIDRQEMFRRMAGTAPLSVQLRRMLAPMFLGGVRPGKLIGAESGGARPVRFLRMDAADGRPRPLFRLASDTYLNYVELVLARRSDGEIRAVDLHNLALGGLQTADGRATLMPSLWVLRELNVKRALMAADLMLAYSPAFRELMELSMKGRPREVDELFSRKAEAFKLDKKAHRLRLAAASQIDADAYSRAVLDMEKCFPGDPGLLLLKLGSARRRADLEDTLAAAAGLEKWLKGDPYLDVVRALAHLAAHDPASARACAARAVAAEPDLGPGWWTLVNAALAAKDFAAVADTLSKIEEKLGVEIGDLRDAPAYAEFVTSREYAAWAGSRKK